MKIKKHIAKKLAFLLAIVMTVTFLNQFTCFAYTEDTYKMVLDEDAEKPYYIDYTFDDFYALPDEELSQIFQECGTLGTPHTVFLCCAFEDNKDSLIEICEPYFGVCLNSTYTGFDEDMMDAFCSLWGISYQYVRHVDVGIGAMCEAYGDMIDDLGYSGAEDDVFGTGTIQYSVFWLAIKSDEELGDDAQKVRDIIATLLSLNEIVFWDEVATMPLYDTTTTTTTATDDTNAENVLGDINLDGRVNLADAVLLNQYAAGAVTLSDTALARADLNGDEVYGDVNDALILLKFLVRLVDMLPYDGA